MNLLNAIITFFGPHIDRIMKYIVENGVSLFVFNDTLREKYKTEEAFKVVTARYAESIADANRSLGFSVSFAALAAYTYLVIPPDTNSEIPFIGLSISREIWIQLAPVISIVLQVFVLISLFEFLLFRLVFAMFTKDAEPENFAFLADLHLKGALGHLWTILRFRFFLKSRINYIWYLPTLVLILLIYGSPIITCLFFVTQLFFAQNYILGYIYVVVIIPYFVLLVLILMAMMVLRDASKLYGLEKNAG